MRVLDPALERFLRATLKNESSSLLSHSEKRGKLLLPAKED